MTSFPDKNGTPRQGSVAPASRARLEIEFGNNPEHSLAGLLEFSHVWLLFLFHQNGAPTPPRAKVKPPRLDGATKGVFATRAPHRPNPIGLSLCKLDGIEGHVLQLSGVDLVDGTPILDIKPFIPSYDTPPPHEEVRYPLWSSPGAHELLQVHLSDTASADLRLLKESKERPRLASTWEQAVQGLSQVLAADPRSVYRRQKCPDDLYPVHYDRLNAWSVRV
jgi:tRNA-Thr(GGU) m(6)t(6)A37 methyltransferase TsaA